MDRKKYLSRIGLSGEFCADKKSLFTLQEAHLRKVPYENCEICLEKKVPDLSCGALFEKIVERGRGGYCFELNGLFANLLSDLGFRFTQAFARWHFREPEEVPVVHPIKSSENLENILVI